MAGREAEEATILKTSMSIMKERCSVDPRKYSKTARELGHQFGVESAKRLSSSTLDSLVRELGREWHRNKIGEFHWIDLENGILSISHCSDCTKSYSGTEHLCAFKEGFLEAVLSEKLRSKFTVTELRCCGGDGSSCVFEIKQRSSGK